MFSKKSSEWSEDVLHCLTLLWHQLRKQKVRLLSYYRIYSERIGDGKWFEQNMTDNEDKQLAAYQRFAVIFHSSLIKYN